MPADTIYGLSTYALNQHAVERVYALKGRDERKPLIVLISHPKMLDLLSIDIMQVKSVEKYWPGPLTLICQADNSPAWLHRSTKTLAVRIPAEGRLLELIEGIGPLVSTSANPEGQRPAASVGEAIKYFDDKLDFYIDGGDLSGRAPSTIARQVGDKLEVVRQGAVEINQEERHEP